MENTLQQLIGVLREARELLSRPDNNFLWSSWENAEAALCEPDAQIADLEAGRLPREVDLHVLFAPTGPIQEVSLSSGWAMEFLHLAEKFDAVATCAYPSSG